MDKYVIITPEAKGTFFNRLNYLYLAVGSHLNREGMEGRTLRYSKVFLSDSKNQVTELNDSLLYKDLLVHASCTVIEQPPLCGSKISVLVKTSDDETPVLFQSLRLTADESDHCNSYDQTRKLFDKYLQSLDGTGLTMERNLVRTWIYVENIDANYQGVVTARNDVFAQQGLNRNTHYIASTGIGGSTPENNSCVAMDFLTLPDVKPEDIYYLQAIDHLNPTYEYGVAFERGTRVTLPGKWQYFISGTASIDKEGNVVWPGDIKRQTGRLLENIGALLSDGGATMNDIQYFLIYLRDISDYTVVEALMNRLYPDIPHLIVEARVCRPGWLIEMECIAEKKI